jgi:WD40 repeat protein
LEKNMDVMVSTHRGNVVYNGCRNHYVRRIKISNRSSLPQLEPPHYDIISGLGWLEGHLISASKDRVLKVWNVDHKPSLVNQYNNTHKDYINFIRENQEQNILLSADNAGEIKFWALKGSTLDNIGGLIASSVRRYNPAFDP